MPNNTLRLPYLIPLLRLLLLLVVVVPTTMVGAGTAAASDPDYARGLGTWRPTEVASPPVV